MGFSSYQLNYSKNNNNSHTYFCYYQLLFSFKEKSGDFFIIFLPRNSFNKSGFNMVVLNKN